MATLPFRLVGFDLDGTLLDTSFELCASLNHALISIGRPPVAQSDMRNLVGRGAKEMLRRGLAATGDSDETMVEALFPILIDHYTAHLGSNSPALPGLVAALDQLAAMDVTLAVVTNKLEGLAVPLLAKVGLLDRFALVLGGDSLPDGQMKPNPDLLIEMMARLGIAPQHSAFVGDSDNDTRAAQAAGISCIAVSFGFLTGPLSELGGDMLIDHYDALLPALATLAQR